jgi:hypothetical protein
MGALAPPLQKASFFNRKGVRELLLFAFLLLLDNGRPVLVGNGIRFANLTLPIRLCQFDFANLFPRFFCTVLNFALNLT